MGKGNCTDFHSLFMALAIASGMPARFRMGFSLPQSSEGTVAGYHCWAEFYAEGSGWIPVDISEAWKNPRREDFYFGRLDGSRVQVSTGREIRLSPPQSGRRLNFLSRPYAEADGAPVYDIEFVRRYKDERARSTAYLRRLSSIGQVSVVPFLTQAPMSRFKLFAIALRPLILS